MSSMQDELTVKIESFSNLGYGIARADGVVIFTEGACPGDLVKIKITKRNKTYYNAKILEILEPSPYRVRPFCAMQKVCGACQMQFIDYDYQLKLKKLITDDAMKNIGALNLRVNDAVSSPDIKEYRHKIQYPVAQTKVSKRILAGYYKAGSHEIVNIKHCPIQPEICDRIVEFIRNKAGDFGIPGYDEKKHSGDLRHIVIRNSVLNGENLVVLVINGTKVFDRLKKFAQAIYDEFDAVSGVCVNFNSKRTNVILGGKSACITGSDFIEERILDKVFKIGANTFFQVNPKSAENIFGYVKDYIKNNFKSPLVLDAYAGIAAFGICVSDVSKYVVSVEENAQSCEFARDAARANNINNIEIHNTDAAEFFAKEKRKFDVIILDPPRKGCTKESLDNAVKLCKGKIIYVSCNPATLARDLKYLTEKGAKIESVQPFDMFCHTYHVENVAIADFSQNIE